MNWFGVEIRLQLAADAFERHDLLLHVIECHLQIRAVEAGIEFAEIPLGKGVGH